MRKGVYIIMLSKISYSTREGFKGILRNRPMAMASISSVAASLFVLGIVMIIILNINNFVYLTKTKFDKIQVYINNEYKNEQMINMKREIALIEGVKMVEFESKKEALKRMQIRWAKEAYLLEGMEDAFQNSYIIHLNSIEDADQVAISLENIEGIQEIRYYKGVIQKLIETSNSIKKGGLILIVLLSIVSLFIISNTIKLALFSRKREINIMKYVGATNWFIRGPFIIEGMFLGTIGSLISLFLIKMAYDYVYNFTVDKGYSIFIGYILPTTEIVSSLLIVFLVMGCGIGILGSIISLRRHLKV